MDENATTQFLGKPYAWSGMGAELVDVQPLFGGLRLTLLGRNVYLTDVAPGGGETRYRLPLWRDEKEAFCRVCIEQDFLTIRPPERNGLPDEARPAITLKNRRGQRHTVAKWAGVADERFEAVYAALLAWAAQARRQKPVPEPFRPWQKAALGIGLGLLVLLSLLLAGSLARQVVAAWWPAHLGRLVTVLLGLTACAWLLSAGLYLWEQGKRPSTRHFDNVFLLVAVIVLSFALLLGLPLFLQRVSMALWADTAVGRVVSLSHNRVYDAEAGWMDYYNVRYTYRPAEGGPFTRTGSVGRAYFESLSEGDPVTVYYLPFFPRYAVLNADVAAAGYAVFLYTAVFALYLSWLETAVLGPPLAQRFADRCL